MEAENIYQDTTFCPSRVAEARDGVAHNSSHRMLFVLECMLAGD